MQVQLTPKWFGYFPRAAGSAFHLVKNLDCNWNETNPTLQFGVMEFLLPMPISKMSPAGLKTLKLPMPTAMFLCGPWELQGERHTILTAKSRRKRKKEEKGEGRGLFVGWFCDSLVFWTWREDAGKTARLRSPPFET